MKFLVTCWLMAVRYTVVNVNSFDCFMASWGNERVIVCKLIAIRSDNSLLLLSIGEYVVPSNISD